MIEQVHKALLDYEQKVSDGEISNFSVQIASEGLFLQETPPVKTDPTYISLSPELHNTLQIFFTGVKAITFGTFDYTTLKSLLNAHGTLERMAAIRSSDKPDYS